jgi:outer membrane protein assembly factor BamB
LLPILALAVLAGCGGGGHQATTTTTTPASKPRVHLRTLSFSIVDGDTGRAIPGARVSAPGAVSRGRALLVKPRTRALTVTGSAAGYGAETVQVALGVADRTPTITLYRPDAQWLMYGTSPSRTQAQEAIRLRPPFRVVWGRNLGTLLEFPAVVDDGIAYLSNLSGRLFALSMATGKTIWEDNLHTAQEDSSPAIVGADLVAHVKAGRVAVIDRANGKVRWSWVTSGEVESSPVVEHGIDYLGDWAGDVYALDLKTRKPRWVYHDGCKITASVAIDGNALYLGDYCGRVLALAKRTGKLLWTASAGSPVYGTSAVARGRLYVPSRDAGALYAFTTHGQYLWHVSTGDLVYSAPAVWHGRVYFGSYSGELYCVSAATGNVLWTLNARGEISGSPTVIDGVVYAGTFSHRIVGASALTGKQLFSFPHGEYVAVSGNAGRLLLYGWGSVWAVEPKG